MSTENRYSARQGRIDSGNRVTLKKIAKAAGISMFDGRKGGCAGGCGIAVDDVTSGNFVVDSFCAMIYRC